MRLLFAIGVAVSLQTAQAGGEVIVDAAGGDTMTNKKPEWGFGAVSQKRHEDWIKEVKAKIGPLNSGNPGNIPWGQGMDSAAATQEGKDLFQNAAAFPNLKKGIHMERSEATFNRYANSYKGKMDKVQHGIEGLAQLHTTHDEMWHRICAIAERGAKDSMIKFQKAILEFKKSMIAFRASHTAMLKAKQLLEVKKQSMIMALQKWLTARKAHAHAHARYVNFLHHLGLNFNDQNPAARYWRTYSHGETGRRDDGSLVGGWTPARGPSTLIGQHSHKAFINNLESVAVSKVGSISQGAGSLQNWYDETATISDGNGGTMPTPKGYGVKAVGSPGDSNYEAAKPMNLMEDPFWAHRDDKNDISYSGLYQLSQAGKAANGMTNDWGATTAAGVAPQNQVASGANYKQVTNARDTAAPTGETNADNVNNIR